MRRRCRSRSRTKICPSFSLFSRMRCLLSLPFFFFFCAFLQRPILVNGGGGKSSFSSPPPPLAQIPRDIYHSSGELLKEVSKLVQRHPDRLTMETMKAGNKGYAAEILVITYNRFRKPKNDTLKFRILLSFGQHGRELITSELALHLLHCLTGEIKISGRNMISLDNILDNLVIKVVPMENLNGRKLVEAGDLCERRNGRGVDLNRNWSVDWGKKEKDYDPYEENPGAAPFSEPEAQIMRKVTQSFDPHIWVNVHSGMEALFMPYDHKNGTPNGFSSQVMKSVLVDLNHHHFRGRCTVGSGGGTVGYFAHGTTTDYMYDVAKVPISLTFEIYGDNLASANDCFKMFNPIDTSTFKRVLSEWRAAFFELLETGPDQLRKAHFGRMISIGGNVVDGSLVGESREIRKMVDALELGMQELRAYFRLFLLSSVLLMFMFCSRIRMSKYIQTNSSILS